MSTTDKQSAENAADLLESANTVAAQAADAVKTATAQAEGAIEASVEQIRELNEQAIKPPAPPGSVHWTPTRPRWSLLSTPKRNSPRAASSTGSPRWSPPRPNSPNAWAPSS